MLIYPVIDIKNGQCVRTRRGHYDNLTVYSHFPEKVAKAFMLQGAEFLHIIDLDGALVGHTVNDSVIEAIIQNVDIPVQVGGGIRTIQDIEHMLTLGATKVVIGTKAAESPAFIKEAVNIFGAEQLVISIDAKDNMVMTDAWEKVSIYSTVSLAKVMKELGITTVVYTDVNLDGMLQGPNLVFAKELIDATGLDVIVSGGTASLKDLEMLQGIGAKGVILGKAVYEHKIDLKNAIELFQ